MKSPTEFDAENIFTRSGARRNRRVRKHRELTHRQREVFSEAMGLFYDGVPVETLVNLIRMGVAK